jgi:hypothetical protein
MAAGDFSWIVGRHVSEVIFTAPESWWFTFAESGGIAVQCPWRLIENGHIAVSGDDHGQWFGLPEPVDAAARAKSALVGRVVCRIDIREGTADILLDFDGGHRLEIIPISSGYESWQVVAPSGDQFIAQGGGNIVTISVG